MTLRTAISTTAVALSGVALWTYAGSRLESAAAFDYDPNPLGLKRSPYGQVLAMAIQAPIDADWHGGIEVHDMPGAATDHDHDHGHEHEHVHGPDCEHEDCDGHDHDADELLATIEQPGCSDPHCTHDHSPGATGGSLLERLHHAVTERTNPNPPTPGHRLYLRREIERKLRFAYELDPSHYANYTAYHFFLTHHELGTSGDDYATASANAAQLAQETIRYCLAERNDPRPALTAAAAAYNILEIMITRPDDHETGAMRQQLGVLDFCLHRHVELLDSASHDGTWELLSVNRQREILDRFQLALKLRESAEKTIARLEKADQITASHDPS